MNDFSVIPGVMDEVALKDSGNGRTKQPKRLLRQNRLARSPTSTTPHTIQSMDKEKTPTPASTSISASNPSIGVSLSPSSPGAKYRGAVVEVSISLWRYCMWR